MSRGTINTNYSGPWWPRQSVSFKASPVAHVNHLHFFIKQDIHRLQELPVNGDASPIVNVGFGNGCPMDFAFKNRPKHTSLSRSVKFWFSSSGARIPSSGF